MILYPSVRREPSTSSECSWPLGLQLEPDLGLAEMRAQPLVHDLEHVRAELRQPGQQGRQRARPVGERHPQGEIAPGGGQTVPENLGQEQWVDIAPGEHGHHGRFEDPRVGQERGHPGHARRFDHLLGPF